MLDLELGDDGLSVASWGQSHLADEGWRFIEKEKDVQESFWGVTK